MTWNFGHLANVRRQARIRLVQYGGRILCADDRDSGVFGFGSDREVGDIDLLPSAREYTEQDLEQY